MTVAPARPMRVVRTQLVGPFLTFLRAAGKDADELVRQCGLPANSEALPELSLPIWKLREFFDAAQLLAGDPDLGLHVAQRVKRGNYGLVEFIARYSGTIGEVLERLGRYMTLLNEEMVCSFERHKKDATFSFGVPREPGGLGRHGNEFGVGLLVSVGREVTGKRWSPLRVGFPHAAPADARELRGFFGGELRFNQPLNSLTVDAPILELPVTSADPELLSVLERAAGAPAVQPSGLSGDFVAEVRAAIRVSLRDGPPRMGEVAKHLHVSARTLQRRLTGSGTTFQAALDETRHALARQYLKDPTLGISEVAFLLGYSELSTFDRAFKRWTGTSPGQFRG
jgi:AraC-like DNA-binding protein